MRWQLEASDPCRAKDVAELLREERVSIVDREPLAATNRKHIGYEGEVVDLRALRRLVQENRKQDGYVVAESERVCFNGRGDRRRAVLLDLLRCQIVAASDVPQRAASGPERSAAPWNSWPASL